MTKHYYFAYGSCMSPKDIQRTTPAEFVSAATLYDYKLAFTRYSAGRRGGVADIVPSVGDYVEGVLLKISDLKALDRREGHPFAYKRKKVRVLVHSRMQIVSVWTYEVTTKEEYEIQPSEAYKRLIREGAKAYLSKEYRKALEANLKRFRAPHELPIQDDWEEFKKGLSERMGTP
jgi:cation transport regulator ChaC